MHKNNIIRNLLLFSLPVVIYFVFAGAEKVYATHYSCTYTMPSCGTCPSASDAGCPYASTGKSAEFCDGLWRSYYAISWSLATRQCEPLIGEYWCSYDDSHTTEQFAYCGSGNCPASHNLWNTTGKKVCTTSTTYDEECRGQLSCQVSGSTTSCVIGSQVVRQCTSSTCPNGGTCSPACGPGDTSGCGVATCSAARYACSGTSCVIDSSGPYTTSTCDGKCTASCTNGEDRCTGCNTYEVCESNKWVAKTCPTAGTYCKTISSTDASCQAPTCGNGTCECVETAASCPADCGGSPPPPPSTSNDYGCDSTGAICVFKGAGLGSYGAGCNGACSGGTPPPVVSNPPPPPDPPKPPMVITDLPTGFTPTATTFMGRTIPNGDASNTATAWFRWGTTNPASCASWVGGTNTASQPMGSGTDIVSFSQSVSTSVGTTYFYCAIASNSFGIAYGSVVSFRASSGLPPTVQTDAPTNVTGSSATLWGTANPNGNSTLGWFRYTDNARMPASGLCSDLNDSNSTKVALGGNKNIASDEFAAQNVTAVSNFISALLSSIGGTVADIITAISFPDFKIIPALSEII